MAARIPKGCPSDSPIRNSVLATFSTGVQQIRSGEARIGSEQLGNPELWDDSGITVSRPGIEGSEKLRCFAAVLGPERTQQDTFVSAGEKLLEAFLGGEDCALLAYGQTGSGKTYTMFGESVSRLST
jgi:hypothetical protein